MTLDSYEVLLTQPDFARAPKLTGRRGISLMASGQARRLGLFPTGGTRHVLGHRFAFTTRAAARTFEDFFNDRRGSWAGFLVPGWHAELEPLQSLAPGNTSLAITAVNYAAVYLDTAKKTLTGHYIYLLNNDGDFHATKVLSATAGTPEILTLRDAVPDNYLLGTYHVGFLYHARFMRDRLLFEFSGPEYVECDAPMIELVENVVSAADEEQEPDESGPAGGTNAEAGSSGSHYWLRCESPILGPVNPFSPGYPQAAGNTCPATAFAELTLPLSIGGPRPVTIRVRQISECKGYSGGTPDGQFYRGGTPNAGDANIFKLTVGTDVYYINYHGVSGMVAALDYSVVVTMAGGDVVRFEYDSRDSLQYNNSGAYSDLTTWAKDGSTLLIADVPPGATGFNGQFAQIDFTL